MVQKLPFRKFVIGDIAYVCSETLLTPFSGLEKDEPAKDAFNFYLSQLRIRIEQTFGIDDNKVENPTPASTGVHYKVAYLLH